MKRKCLSLILVLILIASMVPVFADSPYVASKNSEVFHISSCSSVDKIKDANKIFYNSADEAVASGRKPCSICSPPLTSKQVSPVAAQSAISVTINGVPVKVDPAPFVEGGRTYVPVRAVLEAYGVDSIGWESPNVLVSRGATNLRIPVGENRVIKNGTAVQTDAAAMIKDGRTCLPIRAVIEALGGTVGWDANTRTVIITKPNESSPVATTSRLNIHFIDVGQGDSVF